MKLEKQTLADAVYDRLRSQIVTGALEDGAELNSVALADHFGVSRVPVREALQRLMAESLVSGDSYRRVVVATLGQRELAELLAIRQELEVFGIRRQLVDRDPVPIARARKLNQAFKGSEGEGRIAIDREIHAALMGNSPAAAKIVDDIRTRTQRYVGAVRGGPSRRVKAHQEHELMLDAVEAGDVDEAVRLLCEHIGATRRLLTAQGELTQAVGGR